MQDEQGSQTAIDSTRCGCKLRALRRALRIIHQHGGSMCDAPCRSDFSSSVASTREKWSALQRTIDTCTAPARSRPLNQPLVLSGHQPHVLEALHVCFRLGRPRLPYLYMCPRQAEQLRTIQKAAARILQSRPTCDKCPAWLCATSAPLGPRNTRALVVGFGGAPSRFEADCVRPSPEGQRRGQRARCGRRTSQARSEHPPLIVCMVSW